MAIKQLENDLVIVFGFPRQNARIAVARFMEDKLCDYHTRAIKWLLDHPYAELNGPGEPESNVTAPFKQLDNLNFRISEELADDMA